MAYNLAHFGSISLDQSADQRVGKQDPLVVPPTSYRAPGYPMFLALAIVSHSDIFQMKWKDFFDPDQTERLAYIKKLQILLLLLTYIGAALTAYIVTGSSLAFAATLFFLWYYQPLHGLPNGYYSENMICTMVSVTSALSALAFRTRRLALFFICGLSLGYLTLTRATFLYSIVPLIGFAYYTLSDQSHKRRMAIVAVLVIGFSSVVMPYMIRNKVSLGHLSISSTRGGRIIAGRTRIYNQMTRNEWYASFLKWGSPYMATTLLNRYFEPEDYARLDKNNPNGFRQSARRFGSVLGHIYGKGLEGESRMKKEAINSILTNPFRHIAVSMSLWYKGARVSRYFHFDIAIYLSMFFLFIIALIERKPVLLAGTFVAVYSQSFYAFFSHFIHRYSRPTIAVGVACFVILAYFVLKAICSLAVGLLRKREEHTSYQPNSVSLSK
jgi:hypothetical protein